MSQQCTPMLNKIISGIYNHRASRVAGTLPHPGGHVAHSASANGGRSLRVDLISQVNLKLDRCGDWSLTNPTLLRREKPLRPYGRSPF